MLEEALARKLIEHVTKYTTYNVNIMNEKGISRCRSQLSDC